MSIYLSDFGTRTWMGKSDKELSQFAWNKVKMFCPTLPDHAEVFSIHRRDEAIPVHSLGRYRLAAEAKKAQGDSRVQFCGENWASTTIEGAIASAQEVIFRWE